MATTATATDATRRLVSRAFNPRIALIASPEAQALCAKNNLTASQLISPFSTLTTTLYWHEPTGTQIIPRHFRITPVDIASWKPPRPDTQRNKQLLQSRVARIPPNFTSAYAEDDVENNSSRKPFESYKLGKPGLTKEYELELPTGTPWFESWRNEFLRFQSEQQLSLHEFMSHFIGCILVISSSEGRNVEELNVIIGKLSKLQQQHQTEWPNAWFLPSILKFYLIVHDNSSDDSKSADGLYQSFRTTYTGNACGLLRINSGGAVQGQFREPLVPDPWKSISEQDQIGVNSSSGNNDVLVDPVNTSSLPHPLSPEEEFPPFLENGIATTKRNVVGEVIRRGRCMTVEDLHNIQVAVNEFIAKALLPYVERQTRLLHESIVNRRSMSKSFFSATKRLFGTSKSITQVVYGADSLEIASRKLADLYFLFGNYSGAYQLYHQLKRDFQGDQAWIYHASALEMSALSHFMMTQQDAPLLGARSFPVHYVSDAIKLYLENCRMPDFAVRCAILCCECLMELENYGEAAAVLIRMTSEDCDLRSALMLEQAAYAFVKLNSPRKYALHSVLAGHRYAKAGLRSHSLNSYLQAAQIYYGRGWRFAEDHIYVTITKHQNILLQTQDKLAEHLKWLLNAPPPQQLLLPPQVTSERKSPLPVPRKEIPSKVTGPPLQPSLRLEYSFLTALDSLTHFGLLKIYNLTAEREVVLTGFEFNLPKYRVEKLMPDVENSGGTNPILQLGPSETRSIALRVKEIPTDVENGEKHGHHPHLFLHVKWFFYPSESARNSQSPVIGTYKLRIRKNEMIPPKLDGLGVLPNPEFPITFHLVHKPRAWNDFRLSPFYVCPIDLTVSCRWSGRLSIEIVKSHREERWEISEKLRAGSKASAEGVYFVGQTRWVIDIEALESRKLSCYAAVTHPGVYNVAPLLNVTTYSKSAVAESGFVFECEQEHALHSPLIVAQIVPESNEGGDVGGQADVLGERVPLPPPRSSKKHEKLEISPLIC